MSNEELPDPLFKRVLNRCRESLRDDMDFDSMYDYLISKEVLRTTKLNDIKEEKYTSEKKRKLTDAIAAARPEVYAVFRNGLKDTKQRHLYDLLKKEEKTLAKESKAKKASAQGSASGNDQSDGTPSMSTGQEFATNETSMPASSTYTTNDILDELQESFSGLETRDDNDDRPHLRDHFDACLLFTEGNRDKAEEIRRFIAGRGDDFKVVLYDDEKYFGFFTPENLPTVISKHCVVFMIVIADNLRDDKFANYLRSTISMANANKATVRLVLFSKLDETYIPTSLKNSKLIPWYDKNYLETELPKLLKKCKQVRNDREKKQIKTPEDI